MAAQSHQSDPRILGRRTLEEDHRTLAALLRPGMSVLDVGCGTGAITAGIARAVGPGAGRVVGIDRNTGLLEIARRDHAGLAHLRFEQHDVTTGLPWRGEFDIVTAARTLQWIADPGAALAHMRSAAKPGGMIVVLDYNHARNTWEPDPPESFQVFYRAFLDWRAANGWDNEIGDRLPALFRAAGLDDVESRIEDEVTERSLLWAEVIDNVGAQIAEAGFYPAGALPGTRASYEQWALVHLRRQSLNLRAVVSSK